MGIANEINKRFGESPERDNAKTIKDAGIRESQIKSMGTRSMKSAV
jgi:hypothetical protein